MLISILRNMNSPERPPFLRKLAHMHVAVEVKILERLGQIIEL